MIDHARGYVTHLLRACGSADVPETAERLYRDIVWRQREARQDELVARRCRQFGIAVKPHDPEAWPLRRPGDMPAERTKVARIGKAAKA